MIRSIEDASKDPNGAELSGCRMRHDGVLGIGIALRFHNFGHLAWRNAQQKHWYLQLYGVPSN